MLTNFGVKKSPQPSRAHTLQPIYRDLYQYHVDLCTKSDHLLKFSRTYNASGTWNKVSAIYSYTKGSFM